jgi:hypothetical protein
MTEDNSSTSTPAPDDVARIRESAQRLGIELDEADTKRWLEALTVDAQAPLGADITVDTEHGVFGHKVTMLDFSPSVIERYRRTGEIVHVRGPEGVAESALALSGSSAQSKIQAHPGDGDFFERLNIKAESRSEACRILARLLREHAEKNASGPTYQFMEAKWSNYPMDCVKGGEPQKKGGFISWTPAEVFAGEMTVEVDGEPVTLRWDDLAEDPGWCKLDWVTVDSDTGGLANASNVIDATWESPDGEIVALDGYLDAYFQEVYLDADALPTFQKVVKHVSGDVLDDYVAQLEHEVQKYLSHPNYGKAAKRMYNVFRYSGRHLDAAFVRELFDEPATLLYQVWSLLWTIENAAQPGSTIPEENLRAQSDQLVQAVVQALDGVEEEQTVAALLRLRTALEATEDGGNPEVLAVEIEGAKAQLVNVVNTFFRDQLNSVPTIKEYIEGLLAGAEPAEH